MIVRFADDFVCAFQDKQDAESYYEQLDERLRKFALEVSPEKTNILQFSKFRRRQSKSFEFLEFEFRWGLRRKFRPVIKRRTSRKKLTTKWQ